MADIFANDVANYFLATVDDVNGDNLSNLKLQKLLYYAQGFHLALNGRVLFPDRILAWELGPVVPALYHKYKQYGANGIPQPAGFDPLDCLPELREVLDAVNALYGQYSPVKLANLTHTGPPWQKTPKNGVISVSLLHDYFSTVMKAGQAGQTIGNEPLWPVFSFKHQRRQEIAKRAPSRDKLREAVARAANVPHTAHD
jgi:uncharacterized phage-associated protein